jgi:hypothetical protein
MVTSATENFWAATAEGRFVLQRCEVCDIVIWFPRRHCPSCWTEVLTNFDAVGTGTIYSFTIIRKGSGNYEGAAPFVVAYVELPEGPRIMTNIVDCDPESVVVGMAVEIVFQDTGAGNSLYRFRPCTP